MNSDEQDKIKGEVSALDISIAITDAINIYLREVLEEKEIINKEKDGFYPDHAGSERNKLKYKIALRSALNCLGKLSDLNYKEDEPWIKP